MTYIRMTGGRDRGHVKDFPYVTAQEMLALGQALPVDLEESDALGFREMEAEPEPLTVSSQPSAFSKTLATPQAPPAPIHLAHRDSKKKR